MKLLDQARALLLRLAEGLSEEEIAQAEAEVMLARLRGKSLGSRSYTPTSEAAALIVDEITLMWISNQTKAMLERATWKARGQHHVMGALAKVERNELAFAPNLAMVLANQESDPADRRVILLGLRQNRRLRTIRETLLRPPATYRNADDTQITQLFSDADRHRKRR